MAKTSYLGSNVETQDTFSGWLEQTNKIIHDMGSVVVTVADVAEPNTTNGAWATGNTNLEGTFSSNTVAVQDGLRGGTVSTPATLIVSSNATFSGTKIIVNANTILNGSNVDVTANATIFTSNTVTFNLGANGNTVFQRGSVYIESNTFFTGATANVDVTTLGITANTEVTAATLDLAVATITVGTTSDDAFVVESDTQFNANVSFADDSVLSLGAGGDLKLYHDASDSYIDDVGTGVMKIRSNGTAINFETVPGETLAEFRNNAGVHLYHNNAQKLVTAADGVDITGTLDVSTNQTIGGTLAVTGIATFNANVDLQDSDRLLIGTGDDLQVYHSGSHSYISDVGTGNLKISGQVVEILGVDDGAQDTMAVFTDNSSVDLYFNSVKKFNTKSDGVLISGEMESTTLDVNGAANILGATVLQDTLDVTKAVTMSNTMYVTGQSNVASIMVRDLTETRVVFAAVNGELVDNDALKFTFANTTLATANVAVTGSVFISDDLVVVDNVEIDGYLDVDDTTQSTSAGTGSIVTVGGLGVAGNAWFGTGVQIDTNNGIYLEDRKHGLTFNDGSGNFNLRVGHINSGSGEVSTEAGYAFHEEYSQSAGTQKTQVSTAALAVGDTPTWRTQIDLDPNYVKLAYAGAVKLTTDSDGVDITGDLAASANLVAGHTLTTPRIRGGANEADAVVVQTNMDVMGTTRFGTPTSQEESVGFYGEAIFFNDITLANNNFQMAVANAVITDLTVLGTMDMDLARVTSDLIPNRDIDETSLGNNANTVEIFTNMASRSFSFDAGIAHTANLGLVAYVDGEDDPYINLNTGTNRWSFFNGSGSKYQIVGKVISGTTDVITVNGGTNSSNTEITVSHKAPAAGVAANSDISVNGSNGVVIQDLDLDFDDFGHVTNASVSTYNLDNRYYTETESDTRFVNATGDSMTGPLVLVDTSTASTSKEALLKINGHSTSNLYVENFSTGDYRLRNTLSNNAIEIYNTISSGVRILNGDTDRAIFNNTGTTLYGSTSISGGSLNVTGAGGHDIIVEGDSASIHLKNTGAEAQHWLHSNNDRFYVLANRWDSDAGDWVGSNTWQTPHPLELNSDLNTISSYGSKVLRQVDEGHGNGIDADTTDGLHANSTSVANTLVSRDGNRNFSANNVTFAKTTATEFVATGPAGLAWENGVSRITNNDGGGNAQIRWGNEFENNATRFTHAGSAIYVGGPIDSANAYLQMMVADNGGAGTGSAVSFGDELRIYHNLITWNGSRILTTADEGTTNNLDADTVDNVHASQFLRNDEDAAFEGIGPGSYIRILDNRELRFGSNSDFSIFYDENNQIATQAGSSGSNDLIIHSPGSAGKDIRIGYTGSDDVLVTQYFFDMSSGGIVMEGNLSLGGSNGGDSAVNFWDNNTSVYRTLRWDDSSNDWFVEDNTNAVRRLWHSGNDGPGSGLNADTLDDKQATAFFTLNENETVTGDTQFSGNVTITNDSAFVINDTSTAYTTKDASLKINGAGDDFTIHNFSSGDYSLGVLLNKIVFHNTTGGIRFEYAGTRVGSFDASGFELFDQNLYVYGADKKLQVEGDIYVGSDTANNDRNSEIHFMDDSGGQWRTIRWNPVTNKFEAEAQNNSFYPILTSQDYVGDADTVDGVHASQFLRSDQGSAVTAGHLRFNDNVELYLGNANDVTQVFNNTNYHFTQTNGNTYFDIPGMFVIRDRDASNANRLVLNTATGDLTVTGIFHATKGVFSDGLNVSEQVRLTETSDASNTSTTHAFQIGGNGAANLRMDTNEVMAINNGSAANLFLNKDGGPGGANTNVYVNDSEVVTKASLGEFHFRMEDDQKITFGTDNDVRFFLDEVTNNAMTIESEADRDLIITDGNSTDAIRFKFDISTGNFSANGNITAYNSVSDIRLKENVEVIDNAIDKVQQLSGITFNYKSRPDGARNTGVIAQEVEKVLPEAVYETTGLNGKDGDEEFKAVEYGNMVGLLIEAIKEQQEQIDDLKEQVKDLKEK